MSERQVKAHPKEFREQAVKLALSSERWPREIAEEFEISVDSVRCCVKQAQLDSGVRKDGPTTPEREELRKLRLDIRRVRMEREILARAAACPPGCGRCGCAWSVEAVHAPPRVRTHRLHPGPCRVLPNLQLLGCLGHLRYWAAGAAPARSLILFHLAGEGVGSATYSIKSSTVNFR